MEVGMVNWDEKVWNCEDSWRNGEELVTCHILTSPSLNTCVVHDRTIEPQND